MTRPRGHRRGFGGRIFLAFAGLALALKILIPAGFMVAGDRGAAFPLVICTAQGIKTLDGGRSHDGAPAKPTLDDQVCAFAGHAAGAAAAEPPASEAAGLVAYADAAGAVSTPDAAPGRGLAAPPLPARGPPSLT